MRPANSVQSGPIASDARIRDALASEIRTAVSVERRLTRQQIADRSRVDIHTLDAISSTDPAKHRRLKADVVLSVAAVLGADAVNAVLAVIAYGGAAELDEAAHVAPMHVAAVGMSQLAIIVEAAADNRFDHVERPRVTAAADMLIVTLVPLSSAAQPD